MKKRYIELSLVVLVLFSLVFSGCAHLEKMRERFNQPGSAYIDMERQSVIDEYVKNITMYNVSEVLNETKEVLHPVTNEKDADLVVNEGELVKLDLEYEDPDGDRVKFKFGEPLNESGEWQTKKGDAGLYEIDVIADDGKTTVKKRFRILVDSLNHPPKIMLMPDVELNEGELVVISPNVTDPEMDDLTITFSGWMTASSYKTTYEDAGVHKVTVTVSDGVNKVSGDVKVIVNNVNRAPVLKAMSDVQMEEGDKIELKPVAIDPDGDKIKYSFSLPFDSNGVWQSAEGDAGVYEVKIRASDGDLFDEKTIKLSVGNMNGPPTIREIPTITVKEGDVVNLMPTVTDPEGDEVVITYSGWMITDSYQTTYEDAGEHKVIITATDGINKVSQEVKVVVENVNRAPSFEIVN